ncbi:MAG TPA: FtsX-like permease family protein [Phycisphaerae bacterium]|nr:FtsX-like permease family protein [Phycisphaerae bacterium]
MLRNRRRTFLTLASAAVSLGLLTLIVAMYQSFFHGEDASPSEAMRLVARHKVSLIQPLPASHMREIQQTPGVQLVSAWSWFQGTYKEPKNFFARFAVDADTVFDIHKDWEMPPEQIARFKSVRTACAVSETIAKQFNFKVTDPPQTIEIVGDIYPVTLELQIVGIFKAPQASDCLVFHREYLTELLPKDNSQRDMVGTFLILADSPKVVPDVARAIDDHFHETPYPTHTESEKAFAQSFLAFLGNIRLFLSAICGAVTFTIMLVSANAVAMAVRERTREMAILRTLGFRPGEILQLVLGESVLIALVGSGFGLVIGFLLSKVAQAGGAFFGFQGLKWQGALIVIGASILIGILSALAPALIAARKNVVESLRFTG